MSPDTPQTVIANRYVLQDLIGRGGMGEVYRAYDRLTGQTVALKQVLASGADLSFANTVEAADFRVSLAQEFKLLASLRHPNIIAVLDYGFDQHQQPFYTMEYLDQAETILDAAKTRGLRQKIDLLVQMFQALAYLHRRGILHRDLKPANVLVNRGSVKVLDFGLSVMRDHVSQVDDTGLTAGTLGYIAPEVLMGHPAREVADLYAGGVITYELFAGRHMFQLQDIAHLINDILYTQPTIDTLDLNEALESLLKRLLSKHPEDRYQSALQVVGGFSRALDHSIHVETEATRESFLQAAQFIGRNAELDQLTRALRQAVQGQGAMWLVGGESGVGKSRLLDELRTLALVEGGLVVQGHAVNTAGAPYRMWRPVFSWLPLLRDLNDDQLNVIRAIAPDVPTLPPLDDQSAVSLPDTQTAQNRLIQLIRETFEQHRQPVLLLLEDLHWAGSESLNLLEHLLPLVASMHVLLIGTYRDDETPDLPARLNGAKTMKLARLNEDQIAELSAAMLGEAGGQPQVVDLLRRETEGNVFFIIEVIRTLAEEAGQLEEIGLMTLPQQVFAGGMWRIIQRRLEHVPDYARPMLQLAATGGRQLNLELLHTMEPTLNLERWLVDCAGAAVLEVMESEWRFTHDKLREGVLDGLTLDQRRGLHSRVAEALEKLYGTQPATLRALAYHWGMAEDETREAHYATLAGAQSVRSGAYREAIIYLERTLDLLPHTAAGDAARIPVLQTLGEAYLGIGKYDTANRLYRTSLQFALQTGDQAAEAVGFARLGDIASARADFESAVKLYTASHDLYVALQEPAGVARLLNSLGNVAFETGDADTARRYYHESMEITRSFGGVWSMAGALRRDESRQTSEMINADAHENQHLLNQLDELLATGDHPAVAHALYQLGTVALRRGIPGDAREYFRKSAAAAREIDDTTQMARAHTALGLLELRQNERVEARLQLATALKAAYQSLQRGQQGSAGMDAGLEVLVGLAEYYRASHLERTVELLAFVLYHPDANEVVQDNAEKLVYELEGVVPPTIRESAWERGKTRRYEELIRDLLQAL